MKCFIPFQELVNFTDDSIFSDSNIGLNKEIFGFFPIDNDFSEDDIVFDLMIGRNNEITDSFTNGNEFP